MGSGPPIILVGTQRSSTTWFGRMFSAHPDLAYWVEPRHVWTWGNSYLPDDRLTEEHARPRVQRHIRAVFDRFVRRRGKSRLCEKTPSNCLRLPFIHAVYPDAKIVLIVRDGRSVIRSTAEVMGKGVPTGRILQRALQTPPWEWPAYVPRAGRTLQRKITRKPLDYWGPRPPGWSEWRGKDSTNVMLARQWASTIHIAVEDANRLGPDVVHMIRYENMMRSPRETMQGVIDYVELPGSEHIVEEVVNSVDPSRQRKWRNVLTEETLEEIRPHMEPTLDWLGYEW